MPLHLDRLIPGSWTNLRESSHNPRLGIWRWSVLVCPRRFTCRGANVRWRAAHRDVDDLLLLLLAKYLTSVIPIDPDVFLPTQIKTISTYSGSMGITEVKYFANNNNRRSSTSRCAARQRTFAPLQVNLRGHTSTDHRQMPSRGLWELSLRLVHEPGMRRSKCSGISCPYTDGPGGQPNPERRTMQCGLFHVVHVRILGFHHFVARPNAGVTGDMTFNIREVAKLGFEPIELAYWFA